MIKFVFWEDFWLGDSPLSLQLPSIFRLSTISNLLIISFFSPSISLSLLVCWNLHIRRNLSDDEFLEFYRLLEMLKSVRLNDLEEDFKSWAVGFHILLINSLANPFLCLFPW